MATVSFNHTQMSIEEAVSSTEYGKRMIRLADQFRRDGNNDATNAAFMEDSSQMFVQKSR